MENNDDHKEDANRYFTGFNNPDILKHLKTFNACSLQPISFYPIDRFTGCDGKSLSDELIKAQMADAIAREDYEDASILRDELKRRCEPYKNRFTLSFGH